MARRLGPEAGDEAPGALVPVGVELPARGVGEDAPHQVAAPVAHLAGVAEHRRVGSVPDEEVEAAPGDARRVRIQALHDLADRRVDLLLRALDRRNLLAATEED